MSSPTPNNNPPNRGNRSERPPRRGRPQSAQGFSGSTPVEQEFSEKIIAINRSAKVVKGGRRFSFSALVAVGDKKGRIGLGLGKAMEVSEAIRKAGEKAKQQLFNINLEEGTVPHEVNIRFRGSSVLLKPASEGTGIIAGKTVRSILELVGVRNVLSKCLGSRNSANVAKATLSALEQLRSRSSVLNRRGIN